MNKTQNSYLQEIYMLTVERDCEYVKVSTLAAALKITPQSAHEMIKRLVDLDLIVFKPYVGVKLTKQGLTMTVNLVRRHRVWEAFLTKHLNYDHQEVDLEAEQLEHASSDHLVQQLYLFLGEPAYCHHGHPIPRADGTIPPIKHYTLWDEASFEPLFIIEGEVLDEPLPANLKLNQMVTIIARGLDEVTISDESGHQFVLSQRLAKQIHVK